MLQILCNTKIRPIKFLKKKILPLGDWAELGSISKQWSQRNSYQSLDSVKMPMENIKQMN